MRRRLAVALLVLLSAWPASGASRFLPGLTFRVLHTPHFRVYYHQGEEQLARQLARVAESVYATVPPRLGLPAPAVTHVILANQDDTANGWATPLPYDTVMVTAAWPAPSELIGNTNDWLRLVFTHEYTHILQLHQSRGWARAVRFVFGRAPLAFPNLFLPQWQVEGLATFEETRSTGHGRLASGDSLALVRDRIREAGRERLDQLNGGQVEWPGGTGAYLYGGFFTEYLAKRFGEEKLGELARRTAGRLPYFASPAFRATFGQGLGELWKQYQDSLAASGGEGTGCGDGDGGGCRRVTDHGYYVTTPRFTSDGRLVYATSNPHDQPALMLRHSGASLARQEQVARHDAPSERRLTTRYGGEQISVHGGMVYYDQADYAVNVAWRSDLYAADLSSGRTQRLTRGARLLAPDVSPDGRRLAAVKLAADGTRQLALFRVEGTDVGRLLLAEQPLPAAGLEGNYGSPRWSPDGTRLAAERFLPGGPSEIVVLDPGSGASRVAVTAARGRNLTPAWLADGRSLLFASDREGGAFRVLSVSLETGETRTVLAPTGGALSPEVSPDGRRMVFVGYTPEGYDLYEAPLAPGPVATSDFSPQDVLTANAGSSPTTALASAANDRSYHPLFTLLPRAWAPAGDTADGNLRLGLSAGGVDVLGRHAFGVTTLWRVQGGSDAMFGPHRTRPDWNAFYAYDRWRPTFFVAASDETSFLRQYFRGSRVADAELRETNASVGLTVPFLFLRHGQMWQTAFNVQRDTLRSLRGEEAYYRNALQTGWAFSSAHFFGFSVSPEQGVSIGITSEQVREAFGAGGRADAYTAEIRGYARLGGRHSVLAARAGVGVANGDANVARVFYLGGPSPAGGLIDFGNGAFSMLRGFADKEFAATHVGVANLEYRFPIWRIERGRGTWPLFLRTLHAAVFADVGHVWDHRFSWSGTKSSLGAELSLDSVIGFGLPVTIAAGVARPWDGDRFRAPAAYVRLGRAF